MNTVQYFEEALSLFEAVPSYHKDQLSLAGRVVNLCTPSLEMRQQLLPSLAHLLKIDQDNDADLTIWYGEDKSLPTKLKAPPWEGFNAQGYNKTLCQDDVQIFFQPWQTQLFLYSRSRKIGIYWVRKAEDIPWWECTFSFRGIFHLWTKDLPAQLVHAGAIAKNGVGVLITGQSGSGKSTSCLNLLRAGYDYLGDDYVWVELGEKTTVFTLYQTAKIEPDNLDKRFADWHQFIKNKAEFRQQKAIFDIKDIFPNAAVSQAEIKGILLPKVVHKTTTHLERANPTQTLMAMAPTTLHHLPHNRQSSYGKLMRLSASLPSYHWCLGNDRDQFVLSFDNYIQHAIS